MLKLYNTLTKRVEVFRPLGKQVRMYNCGPTVYDFPHIGNYRSFCFVDVLKRYLIWKGYDVKHVTNITDVDDKIIKKVNESKKSLKEITSFYEKEFLKGLELLNCIKADYYPRATEHIEEMRRLIQKLLDKGYAYLAEDGIYFSISRFKGYGKLSGIKREQLKAGARVAVQEYSKEQASDFALWKAWQEEDGEIFWEPEFVVGGKRIKLKGRPGWHIECSAMSMKYLGESFDIHCGGIDLIFPHHENEIAQSEAATGKKFVRYWLHNAHLLVEGQKMSKSLGNIYTLNDLIGKGYRGEEIRYVLINCHYRETLNFRLSELDAARKTIQHIIETLRRLDLIREKKTRVEEKERKKKTKKIQKLLQDTRKRFEKEMDSDLNLPRAFSVFFEFLAEVNKIVDEIDREEAREIMNFIYDLDRVFGLGLKKIYEATKKIKIPKRILELVERREKARREKNFKLADKLREEIKASGFWVDDTPHGPVVKKL
jgi:cysteinyl-tRNA synthetase